VHLFAWLPKFTKVPQHLFDDFFLEIMAFYPFCDSEGLPFLFNGEKIVVRKEKVLGKLNFLNGLKIAFLGTFYLTNCRVILINEETGFEKYNFALHLNLIYHLDFTKRSQHQNPMIQGKFDKFAELMPSGGSFFFEMLQIEDGIEDYFRELMNKIKKSPPRIIQAFVNPKNPDLLIVQDNS
jgi:hypothetical protein